MGLLIASIFVLLIGLLWYDLRDRRLPNRLVALYAALCPLVLLLSGATSVLWVQHGIVALAGFAVLTIMFILGGMGGGDVKLGTAVLGWAGLKSLGPCLFVIGFTGLVLAVLGLLADWLSARRRVDASSGLVSRCWRILLHALSAKRGVPYGVALAFGGMVVLPAYW